MTVGIMPLTTAATPPPSGAAAPAAPRAGTAAYAFSSPPNPVAPAHLRSGRAAALCPRRPPLPYHRGRCGAGTSAYPLPHSLFPQRRVLPAATVASSDGGGGGGGGGAAPPPRPRRSAADKAAFWAAVEARVGASTPGLSRFWAFAETARGERPRPPRHTLPPTYRPSREFYPGLPPPRPVVDTAGMGWVEGLAAATPSIQAELAAVTGESGTGGVAGVEGSAAGASRGSGDGGGGQHQRQHHAGATYRPHAAVHLGGWSALQLRWEGVQPPGSPLLRMPATAAAVAAAPLAPRSLAFARQAPRTGISPHSDGLNFILTAHVGCTVPAPAGTAWMAIGDRRVAWTEGGVVLFDTAFVHKTWNGGATPRVVLVADVWHPDLSAAEITALQALYACHAERNAAEAVEAADAAAAAAAADAAQATRVGAAAAASGTAGRPWNSSGRGGGSGGGSGGGVARAWWALPWRRG